MFRLITFITVLFCFQTSYAQQDYTTAKTAKEKLLNLYKKGVRLSFNGQPEAALKELEKALKQDPTFIDAQIEWANVKNQQGLFAEAEAGYEKVLEIDTFYEPGVLYSLGIVEYDQEKFEEATRHFEQFLKTEKISKKQKERAEDYLKNARFSAYALAHPVPFEPVNLGPNINTKDHEYLPVLTADESQLIYTAVRNRQEDFYSSKKVNGEWQKGEPIAAVNSDYNEGAQSIDAQGKLLIFTICDRPGGLGRCDLYFTEYLNGAWTPVRNMGSPVNSAAYESLPSISADGNTLYFTSDRAGGKGGLDLWVSKRLPSGKWENPVNLGSPINTTEHEQAPFIHPDGQTLYFMSKGHPGMGAYDLYLSRIQEDGTWGEPENLGYPINTKGNEGAFSVSLDGQTAYFASDMEGGHGNNDIYTFELHEAARPRPVTYVKATVSDAHTGESLAANIEFVDLGDGKPHISARTDDDGTFLVTLPHGKDYGLNVSKDKYLFHSENFALTDSGTINEPFLLDIKLTPIPEGFGMTGDVEAAKPVILKNVFFETGSAALKNASLVELNRLKNLLLENPSLNIRINGHTDNVGTPEDNMELSERRAKAVYQYLVENGIQEDRLTYKGFGESLPIATNDTAEGRRQNRRTEFVIVR